MTTELSSESCQACGARMLSRGTVQFCPACALDVGLREDAPDASSHPRWFGDYEILSELGRGGQGVVYRARQKSPNRVVALKIIALGPWSAGDHLKRFRVEAEAAARLEHPGVVPVYEVGERDGCCFFSMKLLEGGGLDVALRDQPLSVPAASRMLLALARTVQFAHERGVLHRDIKPANVLLDAGGEPHLSDFGLAKLLEAESSVTRSAEVMGTPAYMAPEQAAGKTRELTIATDVYALGAVYYEMLTGHPPFSGASSTAIVSQVLQQEPTKPSELRAGVPEDAETICLKCLEKDPAGRYASAAALTDDIERFLRGEPIHARQVSSAERAWRWCRRNPALAVSIAASLTLLTALTVGSIMASVRIRQESVQRARAEQDAREKLWSSYLAQARAIRLSAVMGRRAEALEAIAAASRMKPSRELRDEAIASLASFDLAPPQIWNVSEPAVRFDRKLFTPDFQRYIVFRARGGAQVFRTGDHQLVSEFDSPAHGGAAVRMSPSGRYIAGTFPVGRLLLWDMHQPGVPRDGFPPVVEGHQPAEFSLDEAFLIVAANDRRLRCMDLNANTEVFALETGVATFRMALNRSGDRLALVGGRETQVWDIPQRRKVFSAQHRSAGTAVAWNPEGRHVVFGFENGAMESLDLGTGHSRALAGHSKYVDRLVFDPRGEFFASASWEGTAFWDGPTGRQLFTTTRLAPFQFEVTGQALGTLREPGGLGRCEVVRSRSFRVLTSPKRVGPTFDGLSFSADGRWLAAGNGRGWILFDIVTGKEVAHPSAPERAEPTFLPDGTGVIGMGREALFLWPIRSEPDRIHVEDFQTILSSPGGDFQRLSVAPDGKLVAVAGHRRSLLLDLTQRSNVIHFARGQRQSFAAISPDKRLVAAAAFHGSGVTLWNAADGRPLRQLITNQNARIAFSIDGKTLISAGSKEYAFWDTATWVPRKRRSLEISGDVGVPVAVGQGGKLWAIATSLQEITLFDAQTQDEVARLTPPVPSNLDWIMFSPEDRHLAATTDAGSIYLWSLMELRRELAGLHLNW